MNEEELDITALVGMFFKHFWLIVATALFGASCGGFGQCTHAPGV